MRECSLITTIQYIVSVKTKFFKTKSLKITLNKSQLKKNIFVDGQRNMVEIISPIVEQKINEAQKQMVDDFESHPVTKEISSGSKGKNSSGILGGYGNLFSFIGFDDGSDPISPLSSIFKSKINFIVKKSGGAGKFLINIDYPSQEIFEQNAQVKWMGGRSWIDGIEKGISGLDSFLYKDAGNLNNSRSGTGIQSKYKNRSVTQDKTPYVSEVLEKFKNRLNQLF